MKHKKESRLKLGEYSSRVAYGELESVNIELRGAKMSENLRDLSLNSQITRFYKKYPNWEEQRDKYMDKRK